MAARRLAVIFVALLATAPLASPVLVPTPGHAASSRNNDLFDATAAPMIDPGSACPGCEGEWNCLGHAWQRCASGRWSDVRPLACGTACTPPGLGYDFHLVHDEDNSESAPCSYPTTTPSGTTSCTSTPLTPATSSNSTSTSSPASSSTPDGFTSGSATAPIGPASMAQHGSRRQVAAIVGIGAAAVVFARLLM